MKDDQRSKTQLMKDLQVSEQRYRALFDNAQEIIYVHDFEGNFIDANDHALTLLGYQRHEIQEVSFVDILSPEDLTRATESTRKTYREGKNPDLLEFELFTRSGETLWVESRGVRLDREGEPYAILGVARDVTERKRAEDRLKALHELTVELSAAVSLDKTLRMCVEAAIKNTRMDSGGIYLVDKQSGELQLVYSKGLSPDFIAATSHYSADAPSARIIMEGQPMFINYSKLDVPKDGVRRKEGLHSIAIIPIQYQGKSIACLNVASHSQDDVADFDRHMLEMLASMIGSFVVRAQERERRKQAEQALRESEEQYQKFHES
jgi:PAS domain S-box-containing protein